MALLGSNITSEVGLQLLLSPLGSKVVVRTAWLVGCSVGIVLPVYYTLKAIEKKDNSEQQRWLIYWAAYGSFSLVEVFSDKLISWVPMYYHMKFAFLVWLQLPSVGGAKQLYMSHLHPFFLRHQSRIDQFLGVAYGEMVKLFSSHGEEIQYARVALLKIMGPADQLLRGDFQPRATNAIEGQRATSDFESDHAYDVSAPSPAINVYD